jgi:hypothetical protein
MCWTHSYVRKFHFGYYNGFNNLANFSGGGKRKGLARNRARPGWRLWKPKK